MSNRAARVPAKVAPQTGVRDPADKLLDQAVELTQLLLDKAAQRLRRMKSDAPEWAACVKEIRGLTRDAKGQAAAALARRKAAHVVAQGMPRQQRIDLLVDFFPTLAESERRELLQRLTRMHNDASA